MPKRVLDVGNCRPDHTTLRRYLTQHFACEVVQAHGPADTIAHLQGGHFDLVLVNRKVDQDYSDGIEIIRLIRSDPELACVAVMLVTNYPEHQEMAMAAGAVRGFGKLEFSEPATREKLSAVLRA